MGKGENRRVATSSLVSLPQPLRLSDVGVQGPRVSSDQVTELPFTFCACSGWGSEELINGLTSSGSPSTVGIDSFTHGR